MAAMPRLSGPSEPSPAARLACGDFPTKTFRRLLVRFFGRRDGAGEEVEPGRSGSSPPRLRADPRTGLRWNGRALDATHFRLARLGGAAFIVLAALTLGAPVEAQVATFVTNYGQVDLSDQATSTNTGTSRAQQFTAGSHAAGYLLDGIDMTVTTTGSATYSAYLCTVGTDGFPLVTQANLSTATSCVSLTKPTTGNKYTPPANTYLASGRTYSIIAAKTGGTVASCHHHLEGRRRCNSCRGLEHREFIRFLEQQQLGVEEIIYYYACHARRRRPRASYRCQGYDEKRIDRRDPERARVERGHAQPDVLVGGHELHRLGGERGLAHHGDADDELCRRH